MWNRLPVPTLSQSGPASLWLTVASDLFLTCWGRDCSVAGWPRTHCGALGCSWILVRIYRSVRRMRSGNAFLSWKSGQETTDCWPSRDHAGHGLGFGSPMTSSSRHRRACRQLFFTQTMGPLGPQEVEHDGKWVDTGEKQKGSKWHQERSHFTHAQSFVGF